MSNRDQFEHILKGGEIFLPGFVLALKTNFSGIRKPEYVDYYGYQGLYYFLHNLLNALTHADASRSE